MADPRQYQYLLARLARADGCQAWQKFKAKARWIDLSTSDLSGRDLSGYDLSGINLSTALLGGACLRGTDFTGANLSFADLRGADLRGAKLEKADLGSANLHDACLNDASLVEANLKGARLIGADLLGADLGRANLSGADLQRARLKYADLREASVDGANVAEAVLTGVVMAAEAPAQWQNDALALRPEPVFKPLSGRLSGVRPADPSLPAIVPGAKPEFKLQPAPEPKREREARPEPKPEPKRAAASHGKPRVDIPVRGAEPDLNTMQGCALVLGISAEADQIEIVKAFRRKAKIYHPDKVRHLSEPEQALATEEFHRLLIAYERMTGRERRPLVGIVWVPGVPRFTSPYEYTIEHYEVLVAANPRNINLLYNLAWKYFDEGFADKAYEGFQRVLSIDPNDEDAMYNIMIVKLYIELLLPEPESK